MSDVRPRVLCVDDDARLLEGLTPLLRRDYDFHTALGGQQGLDLLEKIGGAAVIVSDMRMPGMDGAAFLSKIIQQYPTATRILLTGEPGRDGAMRAVNEGQIFRFLTKPCPPHELKAAINAGIRQHEMMTAERVLLQETLLGSIKALVDVLAMISPAAFGRASRVKQLALTLSAQLSRTEFWQLEAAALLSQVGYLALSPELVEKLYRGQKLTPDEQAAANGVPQVAKRLLGHIPRIDTVLQILDAVGLPVEQQLKLPEDVSLGARVLSLVLDYDALMVQGQKAEEAIESLYRHSGQYDTALVDKLAGEAQGTEAGDIQEIPLKDIRLGMVLMHDLCNERGALLVTRGFEVSASFLERVKNFNAAVLAGHVKVRVPPVKEKA